MIEIILLPDSYALEDSGALYRAIVTFRAVMNITPTTLKNYRLV